MNILIVTGMSGAGKSQVSNILEDRGFKCIDNMPVALIPHLEQLYSKTESNVNMALVIDVRGEVDFTPMLHEVDSLIAQGYNCKILFLDCKNEVLINRFKETRHVHPLMSKNNSIINALEMERQLLAPVKARADYIIDTSTFDLKTLRHKILSTLNIDNEKGISVSCISFGFKYGVVTESDLVFDVRCFPNPYYIETLKHKTGLEKPVIDYVFSFPQTREFLNKLFDMIDFLIPYYIEEGKVHLTISIGCTGGKHRSVAICEALAEHLYNKGYNATTYHRDINIGSGA